MKIGIIGLGYVGAPLAYLAAVKGYDVVGIDNNLDKVRKINEKSNIPIELMKDIENKNINLIASNDYSLLTQTNIVIVCVPTPTKNNIPDLSIMKDVIDKMSNYIKKGCLIIIESTVAPGMTKEYIADYLYHKIGWCVNKDYDLAYCPERIDPGNKKFCIENINRVCGASSINALNRACDFYKKIIKAKIIPMESIEEAELVKVWENSMRNVSIAQVNLLAMICDKYHFSVKKLMQGLESKIEQFGNPLAYPGIGPGGHCIPEDIHYLINNSEKNIHVNMDLLKAAVNINENMPQYAYNKLITSIKNNNESIDSMKILMLGISYKPNTDDTRHSQAEVLYNLIDKEDKSISLYDPIAKTKIKNIQTEEFRKSIDEAEIIIIGCAHNMFLDIDYTKCKNVKYILDCWNCLDKQKIINAGINYIGVGI